MISNVDRLVESIEGLSQALSAFDTEVPEYSGSWLMQKGLLDQRDRLQEELATAVLGQRNPTLQFAFDGPPVRGESLAVPFVTRAMDELQGVIEAVAQALWGEPTARGKLPGEVRAATELRLVGFARGSFGVVLTGDVSAVQQSLWTDQVDLGLLERAVGKLLDVVDSAAQGFPDEKILDDIAELGPRTTTRLGQLCRTLSRSQATAKFVWEAPQIMRRESDLSPAVARGLVDFFNEIDRASERVEATGRLIGARLHRDMFDLQIDQDTIIEGRSSPQARDKMERFFGRVCRASLERTVVRSKTGKESAQKYLLLDLYEDSADRSVQT